MEIKNILFDVAGVVMNSGDAQIFDYYSKKYNLPLEQIKKANDSIKPAMEEGKATFDEFLKVFFNGMDKEIDPDFLETWLNLKKRNEEMFDLVKELRKNYKVYYLTNEGKEFWEPQTQKYEIDKAFDGGVASYQAKLRKPQKEMFEYVCKNFDINPEETIFIDDRQENHSGAKEIGMTTILFENKEQLINDLKKLGIKI